MRRDVGRRGQPQRPDPALRRGALGDPVGVRAADERAPGDEAHHHIDALGHGHRLDGQVVAVDQQRVSLHASGDRQLVEDPGGHAGCPVLGALAEAGDRRRIALGPERQRAGHLQRRAARQPGADRDGGRDPAAQSDRRPHLGHDAGDVAGPRWFDRRGVVDGQPEDRRPWVVGRRQHDALTPHHEADLGPAIDGQRQHQPAGVVRVLADEVHPTGVRHHAEVGVH